MLLFNEKITLHGGKQTKRTFVEKVDFVTSVGFLTGGNSRELAGLPGSGPAAVITNLCILRPHQGSRELEIVSVHPEVNRDLISKSTGWEVRFAESCGETAEPNPLELQTLRDLKERTAAGHGVEGDDAGGGYSSAMR